jgi:type I restriction enzyme M protein
VETHRKRKVIDKYSYKATAKEIADNDYNLNIPRYVDTFEPEAEIDVAAVQKEVVAIEVELADVRERMAKHLKELGIDA